MISKDEILMGRNKEYPLDETLESNLDKLHEALNKFRTAYGKPMIVSSGYRPGKYNEIAHGATNSAHLTCEACDFKDNDGELKKWILSHVNVLYDCGLYMEHQDNTPTWCHLQTRKTINRIFKP